MFGTGILSYFSFLRFLVMVNLIIFLLMFSFVMLPIIIASHSSANVTYSQNDGERMLICFSLIHKAFINWSEANIFLSFITGSECSLYPSSARRGLVIFHEHITDLLSGGVSISHPMVSGGEMFALGSLTRLLFTLQGFLEQTYLFYGYYKVDKIHFPTITYNLPLAYLLVTIAYLLHSLIWIVKRYQRGKVTRKIHLFDASVSDESFFKVCHRIQTQSGAGRGPLSELLQQDFCCLGLLHHQ